MLRPKTIVAITILAAIGGAFYMWKVATDVTPTLSIITGVKDNAAEDSSQDTEEEARFKRAIAFINRFTIDSMQTIPEGYETIETCGPSPTGGKDTPPFCYQIIKVNHTPLSKDALPAIDCEDGDTLDTCLIEQRLSYFKPDYIQNRADIHALEKFIAISAPYTNAKQIQQMTELIATVEKSHAHLIIPPDFAHAKLKLYLAQGLVDPAVAMIKEMQASGAAYYSQYLPQIGAATTLIERGDIELAREFIIKTQHIKFAYPKNGGLLHTVEYNPIEVLSKQLLLAGRGQDAIDFLKQLGPDSVYMMHRQEALCDSDVHKYAYTCSSQLKSQFQHCATDRFKDLLPDKPRTCATVNIPLPVPQKFYKSTPPPAQDQECIAQNVERGYAHSPALLPMACVEKLLWGANIWGRKHQIEGAFQKLLTPHP